MAKSRPVEVNTGKRVWRDLYSSSMMWGSLLTTAGGLVFGGGTNDREFRAFDASTGEQLWHFRTNSGVIAPPSTYTVNGVQYVAVASGWGVDPPSRRSCERIWSDGRRTCRKAASSGCSPLPSDECLA